MDENVYIVVDPDGRKLPYLAFGIDGAIQQHQENDGSEIEGVFVFESPRVGII
ncbi:hypothetical protein REDROCK_76 [Mycobacterium phage RedRock]|uniref:Uncharacterized protein n=1 Tax=Mycobacterium phage RedRock TaxID=711470 RepID=D3JZD8_9CAUD|nr:hypothetical protein REDROCK_76 [Mycobacterium phage RedRock]YP_009303532.1 hypothetical protein SEA_LOSER_79 [Mycobacterium phage Loser]ADB93769.1 hypothetical protein REDROCK_76 [Mycobacterium phage RedRock]AMS00975.1 hypothetical protein SEA_LOSER_79 [Mycobacterium phage Loser]